LTTHGRQYGIDLVLVEYLFDALHGEGQQVYLIGHHGVGHDSSGVAVDQDHFDAFFTQAAGCLGAGIIEFTGLANYNGARTDDEHRFDGKVFGHGC